MSTHVPWIQSSFSFLHDFVLAKLASSSVTVKNYRYSDSLLHFDINVMFMYNKQDRDIL